ncbi:MAG: ligase-associated DNA damage response endonuclease PdeM [Chitinophagaceae bacterium]|nr:ligase-associated DNA damage response endonuclease PdeM [Chitinophagaceae bacterium]
MYSAFKFQLHNQTFWLSPERCLFWEEEQALIVSDIHFGKSGHFRKEGIGIPQAVFKEDLQRLFAQIQFYKPAALIIVGDFFHSHINSEAVLFEKWRNDMAALPIHLITGNHDILPQSWYVQNKIHVYADTHIINQICFVHEFEKEKHRDEGLYYFSGHIHPGVYIDGLARQSLRFPCFYFTEYHAVLPAFGKFTGTHPIKPKKKDKVFAIVNKQIIPIKS